MIKKVVAFFHRHPQIYEYFTFAWYLRNLIAIDQFDNFSQGVFTYLQEK